MDNRVINIRSVGEADFKASLRLLIDSTIIGYRVDAEKNRLILYKYKSDKMTPTPYPMNIEQVISFAWGWFEQSKVNGNQPDHDGDNEKGFNIYNEDWGHVGGEYSACAAITPIWAMYGK